MASREDCGEANMNPGSVGGTCLCNPRGTVANSRCPIHQGQTASAPSAFVGGHTQSGNGPQTGFASGATRSSSDDKIDYEGHISPVVLRLFGEYMHEHRVQRDGQRRASDNWQRGIPMDNYAKSLIRHTQEFWCMWRGTTAVNPDNSKPFTFKAVLCAILFNAMGLLFEMSRTRLSVMLGDFTRRAGTFAEKTIMEGQPGKRIVATGAGFDYASDPRDEAALAPSVEPLGDRTFGGLYNEAEKAVLDKEREAKLQAAQARKQAVDRTVQPVRIVFDGRQEAFVISHLAGRDVPFGIYRLVAERIE